MKLKKNNIMLDQSIKSSPANKSKQHKINQTKTGLYLIGKPIFNTSNQYSKRRRSGGGETKGSEKNETVRVAGNKRIEEKKCPPEKIAGDGSGVEES